MSRVKKYLWPVVTIFLIMVSFALLFITYLDSYELHNEWMVVYPGEDKVYVESRINLYELRKIISDNDLTLRQAAEEIFKQKATTHPRQPNDCIVDKVNGDLEHGILLQLYCKSFNKTLKGTATDAVP